MPTYTFSLTREQMARKILQKLGAQDPIETVQAHDLAVVSDAIDLRLKELHALGILWFNVSGAQTDVAMSAGVATASISAITDFLYPVSLMLQIGNEQQPIEIIGHSQFQTIPDKLTQGEPEVALFDGATIRLHPVPNIAYTAKLTYQAIAADAEVASALDLGAGMARSFIDVVAGDLVDDYTVSEPHASRLLMKQASALTMLRTLNAQKIDTTQVAPNWY